MCSTVPARINEKQKKEPISTEIPVFLTGSASGSAKWWELFKKEHRSVVIREQQREVGCRKYGQVALRDLLTTLFFPSFYCSGAEEWTQSLSHAICTLPLSPSVPIWDHSIFFLPSFFLPQWVYCAYYRNMVDPQTTASWKSPTTKWVALIKSTSLDSSLYLDCNRKYMAHPWHKNAWPYVCRGNHIYYCSNLLLTYNCSYSSLIFYYHDKHYDQKQLRE